MGVRNNKNIGLYSVSLYALSVIAAMSLYSGEAEKAGAMVRGAASSVLGAARGLSRAGSVVSTTSSRSGLSRTTGGVNNARLSTSGAQNNNTSRVTASVSQGATGTGIGAMQMSTSSLPTTKVQHKFGVSAEDFTPVGPIDPTKKYVQYVDRNGNLKTYERSLSTRFELFLKGDIGRDKYVDPTTGRVTSYIYRSKPKWIPGSDIIQAQQAKAEETGSINSTSTGISTLYNSRLELNMVKNPYGGINFVEDNGTAGTVRVHNPEFIRQAQQVASRFKVNETDGNTSTGTGTASTSGASVGNTGSDTTSSKLNLKIVKGSNGVAKFVDDDSTGTGTVKVNNPKLIAKAQQIASQLKVQETSKNTDKAIQTDKVQVSNVYSQTEGQGSQQTTSTGTVKVNNPELIAKAQQIASQLKVQETSKNTDKANQTDKIQVSNAYSQTGGQGSQQATSSGTVKVSNPDIIGQAQQIANRFKVKEPTSTTQSGQVSSSTTQSGQSSKQSTSTTQSASKQVQTEGTTTYRTELRIQIGGKSTSPEYKTSFKEITLKIPQPTDTQQKDVTKITGKDTSKTPQQPSTSPTVKVGDQGFINTANTIASKLKVKPESTGTTTGDKVTTQPSTTTTTQTPTGGQGTGTKRFTSSITIIPSTQQKPSTSDSNLNKDSQTTGSAQTSAAPVQKKNIASVLGGDDKGFRPTSSEITDTKSKLKPVTSTSKTSTTEQTSSSSMVNFGDVSRKSVDLQKKVTINSDDVLGAEKPGKVGAFTQYFETSAEESKKPKASNVVGSINYDVGKEDGKVKVLSKTESVTPTDGNVTKLSVDPNFAKNLNQKLSEGYSERRAQAERTYQQSGGGATQSTLKTQSVSATPQSTSSKTASTESSKASSSTQSQGASGGATSSSTTLSSKVAEIKASGDKDKINKAKEILTSLKNQLSK